MGVQPSAPITIRRFLETVPANTLARWETENPDLVILDINIPETDILELIKKLRQETIVPIMLLTASRSEEFVLEAYQAGVDDCLLKPTSPSLFNTKTSHLTVLCQE